ncbi:Endonuclease/Exonuclease/phosphatase family protein [Ruegeria denitrificans]|uniref:Endonuclease/Exonuclease/phosphatase family protein n=1 Tax=Ruegeria denitrificans TaxID=1715692 RepID=A0A0P1IKZ4_9RHOB|nr:endonuclease/exonuclease/phosphatase family protein [Ruegeria denitrificans]CUK08772.1 Endonuclease/Exonuclease/phosphatase family protein [Ruegeria denitrificans]
MRFLTKNGIVRNLSIGCASMLMGLVVIGFTGPFIAAGDSFALFRPLAGVLLIPCAVVLLCLRARYFALSSTAVAIIAIGSIATSYAAPSEDCKGTCLTLYQKNLMSKAWPRYSLADDILESNAQIVTLQEVSSHNRQYMGNMFEHYPAKTICEFRPEQNVAILTTLPIVENSEFCLKGYGLVGVQVKAPGGGPIWVVSVHLNWPFPYKQSKQSQVIADRIKKLEGPVLIAGDFNMVPWGESVQRIAAAADNQSFGTILNTHNRGSWQVPLPIDNLLFPKGTTGTVELRPFMGSDHLGKLARIRIE